ncbi:hypothetical protein JCM10908_003334 [Rhodotorula pacifica]|uniref:mitochondrial 54S ribosomal protein mL58 MRPL20 n=1 Tax=Rhodotorula pacifica TaxID=1495444 RepID=UPI00316C961D
MFKRALSATAPALKPQQPSATPLRRVRDPLLSSRSAQHFTLESGHSFIVRPPPSVVPPTLPLLPQQGEAAAAFAASPFGAGLASPSSSSAKASLLPTEHYSIRNQHRLPSTRAARSAASSGTTTTTTLSADQISRLHSLRRSDPLKWTRSALAREFQIPQHVVGILGWGEGPAAKALEKERRREVERVRKEEEAKMGWKRSIAREERRRRRSMW